MLEKAFSTEGTPFGPEALVYKVGGKMFSLIGLKKDGSLSLNLKVVPEIGEIIRQQHPTIIPGYHMNKRHWITVPLDGSVPDEEVFGLIESSYHLVFASLTKKLKTELQAS